MGHFFWVFFGLSFWFAWFWVCIWYISGSSPVCAWASFSQDGFQQRGLWVALTSLPFWPPRSFLVRKVSLTSRMRNMWSFISYLGRAQPPLLIILLLIFWSFCPWGMNSSCLPLGGAPSISYLTYSPNVPVHLTHSLPLFSLLAADLKFAPLQIWIFYYRSKALSFHFMLIKSILQYMKGLSEHISGTRVWGRAEEDGYSFPGKLQ